MAIIDDDGMEKFESTYDRFLVEVLDFVLNDVH